MIDWTKPIEVCEEGEWEIARLFPGAASQPDYDGQYHVDFRHGDRRLYFYNKDGSSYEDSPPIRNVPEPFPTHPDFGKTIDMAPAKTLRDEFAMAAMGGDFATQTGESGFWENGTPDDFILERAKFYYRVADTMMAAREVK